jgi:tRNA threonylcarbamoyladenosine biosynthesis protein TsaB
MKVLAIDTATEACSVAYHEVSRCIERAEVAARGHAQLVLPMVESVLAEAGCTLQDLDRLAVGRGPGAFTGLRIAISVAQGLAYGAGLRVVPVSDLAALARGVWRSHGATRVWALIDARMGEVYAGAFHIDAAGRVTEVGAEQLGAPTAVSAPVGTGWWLAGSGVRAYGAVLRTRVQDSLGEVPDALPWAQDVAALAAEPGAEALPPAEVQPVYLRDQVAVPSR